MNSGLHSSAKKIRQIPLFECASPSLALSHCKWQNRSFAHQPKIRQRHHTGLSYTASTHDPNI